MAEGEGFEPPLPLQVKRFSRPPVSTAHTSLRVGELVCLHHCMTTSILASAVLGAKRMIHAYWEICKCDDDSISHTYKEEKLAGCKGRNVVSENPVTRQTEA